LFIIIICIYSVIDTYSPYMHTVYFFLLMELKQIG